ncbi:MAG: hypothetical protein ACRYGR_05000 [Janthinobacterium lividum]
MLADLYHDLNLPHMEYRIRTLLNSCGLEIYSEKNDPEKLTESQKCKREVAKTFALQYDFEERKRDRETNQEKINRHIKIDPNKVDFFDSEIQIIIETLMIKKVYQKLVLDLPLKMIPTTKNVASICTVMKKLVRQKSLSYTAKNAKDMLFYYTNDLPFYPFCNLGIILTVVQEFDFIEEYYARRDYASAAQQAFRDKEIQNACGYAEYIKEHGKIDMDHFIFSKASQSYFETAADLGCTESMTILGRGYELGESEDWIKSQNYYHKALISPHVTKNEQQEAQAGLKRISIYLMMAYQQNKS